ncbi:GNAT family N-acetyltransferase [Prauserella cavernicola]|uniref:GNAT family N-acetyltransferase n=1 Tax=Prauserella cavernicola TaxID=2800127 RepID=A0A934QTC2_9PSEU|nr:GNAT family N-acetyltransferase [Prauserella cavernicola]MBK1785866.1 GNAT family N-acetyltransferase [Prauserella cavernicola]
MAVELGEIRTERLILRRFGDADLPSIVRIQSDPATHPHDQWPATPEHARALITLWDRHWLEHGFGYVAVVEARSGGIVGVGGVQTKDLEGEEVLNLYYRFHPDSWGKGYAPEMAGAVVGWAERALPRLPVVIVTNVGNVPAQRVARKLGFTQYKEDDYEGVPAKYYRNRL